ncbi:MAG: DUF2333 family protein [Gammaproteobacteria bacterium]|nr:DUF2333 family protein [Gammaproteobacteria bacterium]MDH5305153.1 DUF2333 family protein [Gammaproteobacteria bacterium]MDH5323239.1 DUF2333 family protein [Gammaproteobacteria bacterium]
MSEATAASILRRPRWLRIAGIGIAALLLVLAALGIYWSRMPDVFWVNQGIENDRVRVGYATVDTLTRVAATLLEKPGGYLNNDRLPPGVWLDNTPNWEIGVLQQVRDLARVIRNDYSRSQSQSREDEDVSEAEQAFFIDSNSWILPASESAYRDAIRGFTRYRDRLGDDDDTQAQFYARADNLREWLAQVEKRLGSMTRRLGDSVATNRINENLAGDAAAESSSPQPDSIDIATSWFDVDDVFFEARGTAWALLHFFRAAELDFASVLADKNASASVRQIIRELEASLQPLGSPVILNGSGFGFFANHSLVMANYLARANAAVINLRELLDQG